MYSQIYSGLILIFAILRNFRVVGPNMVFFYPIGQKEVILGPLFRSENDENRACLTKNKLFS